MDGLELASALRAKSAIETMISGSDHADIRAHVRAFKEMAFESFRARNDNAALDAMHRSPNGLVKSATAAAILGSGVWDGPAAAEFAAAYLASISEGSLLDQIAKYAKGIPPRVGKAVVASGWTADVVAEGAPKVVGSVPLALASATLSKVAAIVVLSQELLTAIGDAGRRLFENELERAIQRATNAAVLDLLITSNATHVSSTNDGLVDLRAGLRAAAPSDGYVVAASTATATDLSTRVENRGGAGIRGGTFTPGIEIVAVDDMPASASLVVIPASLVAVVDQGFRLAAGTQATVNLSTTPQSESTLCSLWQEDLGGLLAERSFRIATDADVVVVGGP